MKNFKPAYKALYSLCILRSISTDFFHIEFPKKSYEYREIHTSVSSAIGLETITSEEQ